ncbi:MAG: ABC transporter permease [Anaerolineae bacterium]|nr:ABC transporter permease [Anaerolineae bacterium]
MSSTTIQEGQHPPKAGFDIGKLIGGGTTSPLAIGIIVVVAIALVIGAVITPNFLTVFNIKVILRLAAFVGIFAIGLTFVTISGNFFLLSLEETAGLAAVAFATMIGAGWDLFSALLGTLAIAGITGLIQGVIVGMGGNPIIVTLGAAGIIFGAASWYSDNSVILMTRPHPAEWIGTGQVLTVPNVTWAFILLAIIGEVVLRYTSFGRSTYLVGASKDTAHATGYNTFVKALQVFALASAAAAVVGILFAAQISQGQASLFSANFGSSGSLTISAIAAVMVGGTAIFGGRGSVVRTMLGAIFIALADNMMVLNGFESGPRILFTGFIVVFSVSIYAILERGS